MGEPQKAYGKWKEKKLILVPNTSEIHVWVFHDTCFHELFEDLSTVRWCWVRSCCCVPVTAICLYNFFLFPKRNSPICVNNAERNLIQHRCFDEPNVWSIDFEWGYRCGLYEVHNDGVSHKKALTRVLSVSVLKCAYKVFSNLFKKKCHVMKWVLFSFTKWKHTGHWSRALFFRSVPGEDTGPWLRWEPVQFHRGYLVIYVKRTEDVYM